MMSPLQLHINPELEEKIRILSATNVVHNFIEINVIKEEITLVSLNKLELDESLVSFIVKDEPR